MDPPTREAELIVNFIDEKGFFSDHFPDKILLSSCLGAGELLEKETLPPCPRFLHLSQDLAFL